MILIRVILEDDGKEVDELELEFDSMAEALEYFKALEEDAEGPEEEEEEEDQAAEEILEA